MRNLLAFTAIFFRGCIHLFSASIHVGFMSIISRTSVCSIYGACLISKNTSLGIP